MKVYSESMSGDRAPNPQEIADTALRLIEMSKGARPLRIVVGRGLEGPNAINEVSKKIQDGMLKGF